MASGASAGAVRARTAGLQFSSSKGFSNSNNVRSYKKSIALDWLGWGTVLRMFEEMYVSVTLAIVVFPTTVIKSGPGLKIYSTN